MSSTVCFSESKDESLGQFCSKCDNRFFCVDKISIPVSDKRRHERRSEEIDLGSVVKIIM